MSVFPIIRKLQGNKNVFLPQMSTEIYDWNKIFDQKIVYKHKLKII